MRRTFRRSVPQQQTVFAGFVPSLFSIGRKNGSPMLHAPAEDLPSIAAIRFSVCSINTRSRAKRARNSTRLSRALSQPGRRRCSGAFPSRLLFGQGRGGVSHALLGLVRLKLSFLKRKAGCFGQGDVNIFPA